MPGLERLRLSSKRSEASSLLVIESPEALSSIAASEAWWTCHDEGDLDSMVSVVAVIDDDWTVLPVSLETGRGERTDAEALARHGDTVFVFGSSFVGKSGTMDNRRAFVARFSETSVLAGSNSVEVLDMGSALVDAVLAALAGIELLKTQGGEGLVNIEGAGLVDGDLYLGLRWPVSADGQPLLVKLADAASALIASEWTVESFLKLEASAVVVDVDASPKRPAGVRGLTVVDGNVHLVVGQTERGLAAKKVKAAAARHVYVNQPLSGRVSTTEVSQFEGFRKVEGVAPASGSGWLYALDDEDAVVLVLSTTS